VAFRSLSRGGWGLSPWQEAQRPAAPCCACGGHWRGFGAEAVAVADRRLRRMGDRHPGGWRIPTGARTSPVRSIRVLHPSTTREERTWQVGRLPFRGGDTTAQERGTLWL
jgi:hypothetical protein